MHSFNLKKYNKQLHNKSKNENKLKKEKKKIGYNQI